MAKSKTVTQLLDCQDRLYSIIMGTSKLDDNDKKLTILAANAYTSSVKATIARELTDARLITSKGNISQVIHQQPELPFEN